MIKYVEFDSMDETGQHIIPVNSLYQMNKTASGTYSPEIMKVILNMKRKPNLYYVVINALGSHEIWGSNRNGDGFPVDGLNHKSLRTDMGTLNDYGYKTFEYYAHLYKHHVNKDPKKSFGEVVYAHWNTSIQRVELIVGIDVELGKDMVEALDQGEPVAVSMGCKVKFDRCNICNNEAKTRAQYCNHLKKHMNEIVSAETAQKWSRELGKIIKPGTQVCAMNDKPRFFDISKVHVGADRTAYMLGKAAQDGTSILSADIGEATGVTDEMIDKLAYVNKKSEINKVVGGSLGPGDIDGRVSKTNKNEVLKKALGSKMDNAIKSEPVIPNETLDAMSILPLNTIFSTMLGMGIQPKPSEVQRIVVVKIGRKDLADELDSNKQIFDHKDHSCPCEMDVSNRNFSDTLSRVLMPFLEKRSCFAPLLKNRLEKQAYYSSTEGNDYWMEGGPGTGPSLSQYGVSPITKALGGLAAIYAGLKLKSLGYGPKQFADVFVNKPWLRTLIGGGVMWNIHNAISKSKADDSVFVPASDYEGVLQDTNFSGQIKTGSSNEGSMALADSIILPGSYINRAIHQDAIYKDKGNVFPGIGSSMTKSGSNTLLNQLTSSINEDILKVANN